MSEFQYEVVHRKGELNANADVVSRQYEATKEDDIPILPLESNRLVQKTSTPLQNLTGLEELLAISRAEAELMSPLDENHQSTLESNATGHWLTNDLTEDEHYISEYELMEKLLDLEEVHLMLPSTDDQQVLNLVDTPDEEITNQPSLSDWATA